MQFGIHHYVHGNNVTSHPSRGVDSSKMTPRSLAVINLVDKENVSDWELFGLL